MADRVIKPDSGNQLVLQDEGGSAALTIDTSGNITLAGTANVLGGISGPAGMIINVQHSSNSSETNTNSTSFTATGLTDSITTTGSNKVIIIANVAGALKTGADYMAAFSIYRGTTNLASGASDSIAAYDWMGFIKSGNTGEAGTNVNMCYVDSPSAGTHSYTVYYGTNNGSYNAYFNVWGQTSQMILMELIA